jgi:membrane protein
MRNRILSGARDTFAVFLDAAKSYGRDRVGRMAAALAYRTMFAIAPLLLLVTGVFGLIVDNPDEVRDLILGVIDGVVGSQVSEAIQTLVTSAVESSEATTAIGFALFAWASSSLFMDLQMGLNDIFGVPQEKTTGFRAFVRRRLIAIAWSISIGLLLVAAWLTNAAAGWLAGLIPETFGLARTTIQFGARLIAFIMFPLIFVGMYRTMTRARLHPRAIWVGGLVTSLVFFLTAIAAGVYFSWDEQTSAGQVAGSLVVLLLTAYLLSSALLFGAQVTRAYHDHLQKQ